MATSNYPYKDVHLDSLIDAMTNELKAEVVAVFSNVQKTQLHVQTASDLSAGLQSELDTVVSLHTASAFSPIRIYGLAKDDAAGKHFHNIDYKKEMKVTLQKTVTFGEPGLLTSATLFEDEAKTLKVLRIDREYEIEAITGKLLKKRTKRTYYNEDGTEHDYVKDPGWYHYTEEESRKATHRRRENITNRLEGDMLQLLSTAAGGDASQKTLNIQAGVAFMKELSPAINAFHLSGSPQAIVDMVSDSSTQATYSFLLADVAPGVKAYQFIIAGVTY